MNFRHSIILVLALMSSLLCLGGRQQAPDTISARRAFVELPPDYLDVISRDTRLDMLDYLAVDSIYKATNNLMEESYIERLTPGFMSVKVTPSSTLQLKVLRRSNGGEIVMAIYTIGSEEGVRDSEVAFFDARMKRLPSRNFFPVPELADFVNLKGKNLSLKDVDNMLPFQAYLLEADVEKPTVRGSLSYRDAVSVETAEALDAVARPDVEYVWNGKNFRISKQ